MPSHIRLLSLLLLLLSVLDQVQSLSVLPDSPCFSSCNGGVGTSSDDVVCFDGEFEYTDHGQVLQSCLTCLSKSTFIKDNRVSDQYFFLYNLNFIQQVCLSRWTSNPVSQCTAKCDPVELVLSDQSKQGFLSRVQYSYCWRDSNAYTSNAADCATCLQAQPSSVVLGKLMSISHGACIDQPQIRDGNLVQVDMDDMFNTKPSGSNSTAIVDSQVVSASSTKALIQTTTAVPMSGPGINVSTTPVTSTTYSIPPSQIIPRPASVTAATATSKISSASQATSSSSERDNVEGPSSLKPGVIAAVVIVVLAALATIVLVFVFVRRRRLSHRFERMPDTAVSSRAADVRRPPPAYLATIEKTTFPQISPSSPQIYDQDWYNAANPRQSEDLSALPQREWL